MRILCTGSRHWEDRKAVAAAMATALFTVPHVVGDEVIFVHGGCPTGADYFVEELAHDAGFKTEVHRADWANGRKAGPIRNKKMVELGADLCIAFPLGESKGTRGLMKMAQKAGIEVRNFGDVI